MKPAGNEGRTVRVQDVRHLEKNITFAHAFRTAKLSRV